MSVYTTRAKIKGKGYHATVKLTAKFYESKETSLSIVYHADKEWGETCRVGVRVFFNYFLQHRSGTLDVIVEDVHSVSVDTHHLTVMFTVIKALSQELKFDIDNLKLDEKDGGFIFP